MLLTEKELAALGANRGDSRARVGGFNQERYMVEVGRRIRRWLPCHCSPPFGTANPADTPSRSLSTNSSASSAQVDDHTADPQASSPNTGADHGLVR